MAKVNRKLATILAADCVDFSKFMEIQEELTLANLSACREIIDPIIEEYGGRIFHTAGDSVIADFGSPVECVHAAMKFQEALIPYNWSASWIDNKVRKMINLLNSAGIPSGHPSCKNCAYARQRSVIDKLKNE